MLSRLIIGVDPGVDVRASELARSWNEDTHARRHGRATAAPVGQGAFLPELTELVTIPLAVNLASNLAYDIARRVVVRLRTQKSAGAKGMEELEIIEHRSGQDQWMIVRSRREMQ